MGFAIGHQQNLIEDNVRAGAYYASVMENKLDFSGCVVLHVGAGSGVLALCAAQAGAKHVYLVEASEYALKLIDENPTLSELITVSVQKVYFYVLYTFC